MRGGAVDNRRGVGTERLVDEQAGRAGGRPGGSRGHGARDSRPPPVVHLLPRNIPRCPDPGQKRRSAPVGTAPISLLVSSSPLVRDYQRLIWVENGGAHV